MSNSEKGKFIVLYGMNNIGKSTVVEGLVSHLKNRKKTVQPLKYPVYEQEPTGPRINAYLRKGNPEGLTSWQAQQLFAQNRREYEPSLRSILEKGTTVVAEDYIGTGIVWGILYGCSQDDLEKANSGLLKPDVEILLDGERFLTGKENSHLHEQNDQLWQRGRQIHLELAQKNGWRMINANQSREKVLGDVISFIYLLFP